MKDVPWLSVQPRKVRQQLDGLLTQLKDLPSRLRTYPGYEHVLKLLQSYTKVNILISELKSDALKDRHWNTIRRDLGVQWVLSDLCLGQVGAGSSKTARQFKSSCYHHFNQGTDFNQQSCPLCC